MAKANSKSKKTTQERIRAKEMLTLVGDYSIEAPRIAEVRRENYNPNGESLSPSKLREVLESIANQIDDVRRNASVGRMAIDALDQTETQDIACLLTELVENALTAIGERLTVAVLDTVELNDASTVLP